MWVVTVEMEFEPKGIPADVFRGFALNVYSALEKCDGLADTEMEAELAAQIVSFRMGIRDMEDEFDAVKHAATAVRTALHAAGASTANWDELWDDAIQRLSISSERALVAA